MKKVYCPYCKAAFESMDFSTVEKECPNCHELLIILPGQQPKKITPFSSDIEDKAQYILDKIHPLVENCDESVKQCVLWRLEDDWIGEGGHITTIKIGKNIYDDPATCSICGKDTTREGLLLHVKSRWRGTTILIYLCEEHKTPPHIYAADFDIHKSILCPRLGLD